MKRDSLIHDVRQRLKRLPSPYDNHYGVVPLPPPEQDVRLYSTEQRSDEKGPSMMPSPLTVCRSDAAQNATW